MSSYSADQQIRCCYEKERSWSTSQNSTSGLSHRM